MLRRTFLFSAGLPWALALAGCRGQRQFARIVNPGDKALMGSHQAGAETFGPLVDEAVAKLLARHAESPVQQVSYDESGQPLPCPPKRICFVGVENKSAEDIGDFKDEIYQVIDSRLLQTPVFQPLNRRFVDAGLLETRLRPDQLCIPEHMRQFAAQLEREGEPIDFLLYAVLTSGTTRQNRDYERSYRLTMELIDVRTGDFDKQSADLVKGYHHSRLSRWRATNPFSR
jgi:hypothetical protein